MLFRILSSSTFSRPAHCHIVAFILSCGTDNFSARIVKKLLLMNCRPPRRSRSVLGSGACCMRNLASPPCPRSQNTAVTFCKIARLSNTNIINSGSVEFFTSYAEVSTFGLLVCYCQCCKCRIQGGAGGRDLGNAISFNASKISKALPLSAPSVGKCWS